MSYKIDSAIVKKDRMGNVTLIDPNGVFDNEEAFVAIKSDDLITVQLLINSILSNDFKKWRDITSFSQRDTVKSLFVRLGYTKEDIAEMLNEL